MCEKFNCLICRCKLTSIRSLTGHLSNKHKIRSKEYYDKYLKRDGEGICHSCGKETKYKNIRYGYNRFCSNICAAHSSETKAKREQTCLKKYGVQNAACSKEVQEKIKKTSLEKYGVEHPFQADSVKEKIKDSILEKYGCEYFLQTAKCREKTYDAMASEEVKEKIRTTFRKNY